MDSPWRVDVYNPSCACEVAPFVHPDFDVCLISYPFLSERPMRLHTDSDEYSTEML
jgi:hypothetical protein